MSAVITVDQAIRLSKILCVAPCERLKLVFAVMEKADIDVEDLEEIEQSIRVKTASELVDVGSFAKDAVKQFKSKIYNGAIKVPAKEFDAWCKNEMNVRPLTARRALAASEYIQITVDGGQSKYTVPSRIDGKSIRCVVFTEKAMKISEDEDERTEGESGSHEGGGV